VVRSLPEAEPFTIRQTLLPSLGRGVERQVQKCKGANRPPVGAKDGKVGAWQT